MSVFRLYREVVHQVLFVELLSEHVVPTLVLLGGRLHDAAHEHAVDLLFFFLTLAASAAGCILALKAVRWSLKGLSRKGRRSSTQRKARGQTRRHRNANRTTKK